MSDNSAVVSEIAAQAPTVQVQNSQGNYAEVPGLAPSIIDTEMAAFIKSTEAEFASANIDAEIAKLEGQSEGEDRYRSRETDPDTSNVLSPDVAPEQVAKKDNAPPVSNLELEVERQLHARQVAETTKELATLRARLAELEGRQIPEDLVAETRLRPVETWKKMGLDPDTIIRMALAQKMGDKAPPELLNNIRQSETEMQIRNLERRVIDQGREIQARDYYARVADEARTYISKGLKDAPTVAEVAKTAPDRVFAEIMQELIVDAKAKAAKDPNAALMSYDEAAKRVESRWADIKKVLIPQNSPQVQAGQPVQEEKASTNPTQKPVEKKNNTIKPPDRPLAPWLRKIDIQEQGIKEAMDEYRRIENQRK